MMQPLINVKLKDLHVTDVHGKATFILYFFYTPEKKLLPRKVGASYYLWGSPHFTPSTPFPFWGPC